MNDGMHVDSQREGRYDMVIPVDICPRGSGT